MNLPIELNCSIFLYLTDPREIISFILTSKNSYNIFELCRNKIEVLRKNPNIHELHSLKISIPFILQFPNIRRIEIPISTTIENSLQIINLSKLEYVEIYITAEPWRVVDIETRLTYDFYYKYYKTNLRLIEDITITYYNGYYPSFIRKFNYGLYICPSRGDVHYEYDRQFYRLMKFIDRIENLKWITELNLETMNFSKSSLNQFIKLESTLYNSIYGGLSMLKYGYFNRIFLLPDMYTKQFFKKIYIDMSAYVDTTYIQNLSFISPLVNRNKTFHLEIPCFIDYYNIYIQILDYLEDVKTFAIFLDELQIDETIYNKTSFHISSVQDLIEKYHPEKVIIYSIYPYEEISSYFYQSIFEYIYIRNE